MDNFPSRGDRFKREKSIEKDLFCLLLVISPKQKYKGVP